MGFGRLPTSLYLVVASPSVEFCLRLSVQRSDVWLGVVSFFFLSKVLGPVGRVWESFVFGYDGYLKEVICLSYFYW